MEKAAIVIRGIIATTWPLRAKYKGRDLAAAWPADTRGWRGFAA